MKRLERINWKIKVWSWRDNDWDTGKFKSFIKQEGTAEKNSSKIGYKREELTMKWNLWEWLPKWNGIWDEDWRDWPLEWRNERRRCIYKSDWSDGTLTQIAMLLEKDRWLKYSEKNKV